MIEQTNRIFNDIGHPCPTDLGTPCCFAVKSAVTSDKKSPEAHAQGKLRPEALLFVAKNTARMVGVFLLLEHTAC